MIGWLFNSTLGRIVGVLLIAVFVYGGIYAKGRYDQHEYQVEKQLKQNELATKQRKEVDRAVPRTDWPDRVDELR